MRGSFEKGAIMDPFQKDTEKLEHYKDALSVDLGISNDEQVEEEMEAAFKDYESIGSDVSITPSCGALSEGATPRQLTRWIIGDERVLVGTEWATPFLWRIVQ